MVFAFVLIFIAQSCAGSKPTSVWFSGMLISKLLKVVLQLLDFVVFLLHCLVRKIFGKLILLRPSTNVKYILLLLYWHRGILTHARPIYMYVYVYIGMVISKA